MIKFIVFLVILFTAFVFGHTLTGVEGRIIIALPGKMIELGIFTAAMFVVFAILAFWILSWFVTKLLRTLVGSRKWLGAYSRNQQTAAYYESISAMLMNEQDRALKQIRKTIGGDFNGSNYLIAAELEAQSNNNQQAKAYLIQAMDSPKIEPVAKLKQAELTLNEQNPKEAMTLLSAIEGNMRQTKGFVLLKLRILEALNDWAQIQTVAKENKKVLGPAYLNWASRCIKGEFAAIASKQGANALKQHWQSLPRAARKDIANQVVYVQLLIDQGLYSDAEGALVALSSKQHYQEHLPLFKQIILPSPAKAIKYVEAEIRRAPTNAELYSVLAHLAYNSGDFELAKKALNKALGIKSRPADKALLAKILEQANDFEGANAVYQGLMQQR